MKQIFLSLFILSIFYNQAQILSTDSLKGFDLSSTVIKAHQFSLTQGELKNYVKEAKRNYINTKYHLNQAQTQINPVSKYSYNSTNNAPCSAEDFEAYTANNVLTSAGGWTATQTPGVGYNNICTGTPTVAGSHTNAVLVVSNSYTDVLIGTVGMSPLGGKMAKVNANGTVYTCLRQTFPVTSSNQYWNFCYKGVLSEQAHGCCNDAYLTFKAYDSNGNLISGSSQTLVMGTPSCVSTNTAAWTGTVNFSSTNYYYTPNWQMGSLGLGAYTGSVVTFEVIASNCNFGEHMGYMYFDALCMSNSVLMINDAPWQIYPTFPYTACNPTVNISASPLPGPYQWFGPSGSGISGVSGAAITASLAGIYTVVAGTGSLVTTQTVHILFSVPTISVSGTNTLCAGGTATLQQGTSGSMWTYMWSSPSQSLIAGGSQSVIAVSPSVTTTYTMKTTNTYGCINTAVQTITVYPIPSASISGQPFVCSGQSVTLSAFASGIASYTWNTGSTNSSIIVSPPFSTTYASTVTSSQGCKNSSTFALTILPLPQLQITQSTATLCVGKSATLSATAVFGTQYLWSTGATSATISVSPALTSVYTLTANAAGCIETGTKTITVYPVPQIQLIASNSVICQGEVANIGVLGSNIASVNWNTGAISLSISVNPTVNTVYTATATSPIGCISSDSKTLTVLPAPIISGVASHTEICAGQTVSLSVSGVSVTSVAWSNGVSGFAVNVNPTVNTVYTATASNSLGCKTNKSFSLNVNPLPQSQILFSDTSICAGETVTLSVNNSNLTNYQWMNGKVTATIIEKPNITTQYSLTITDTKGCIALMTLQVEVNSCTGIMEYEEEQIIKILPNPNEGTFDIKGQRAQKIRLFNDIGQLILECDLNEQNNYIYKIKDLAKGIYFIGRDQQSQKIIVK